MLNARAIRAKERQSDDETAGIADLEALHDDVTKYWSNIKLHRNIEHVQYAAAISVLVEGGTLYTSDWAKFLAAEAKVRDKFVDLGALRLISFTSSNKSNLIQDPSIILNDPSMRRARMH